MKLKKIFKKIPVAQIKGSQEVEITGVCSNSKLIAPGNLFVARKGLTEDGAKYIPEAISAGAVAILTDIFDPSLKGVTQIIHSDISSIEGMVASEYYQCPSDQLFMVGITGTNGKTTVSFIIKHLLDSFDKPCGLIGTIEYIIGQHRYQATRTTPDVISNHKMLREMGLQGCRAAVMEVTSHALDQGRVQNIEFDVAIFTNLTLDHLDYHQTMDRYCLAKNKLFTSLNEGSGNHKKKFPKVAVVNVDSSWHSEILKNCSAKIFTFAIDHEADLRATDIHFTSSRTRFNLHFKGQSIPCSTSLVGRYNVYNCLAALATGLTCNIPLDRLVEALGTFTAVAGRLEPVFNALGLQIYVDFAHSDDALRNVLVSLREITKGKIITVFGCGGDRDQTKRPKMAQVSEAFSDFTIVTLDNPRSEDPQTIITQICEGFQKKESYFIELDRRLAIGRAINLAATEDLILIAGKGHEGYQIFAHQTIEFDDRKVAAQLCQEKALLQRELQNLEKAQF